MNHLFTKNNRGELIIGSVVLICLLLSSNLFGNFMPSSVLMIVVAVFVAASSLFAVLIWRENPKDEREAHILLSADRLGFLAGAVVLSGGLVYAALNHQPTNLLALTLAVMILAKLFGKYLHK